MIHMSGKQKKLGLVGWLKKVLSAIPWLALWLGSLAITLSSLVYFNGDELAAFVIEKLPLPSEDLYLLALRFHVAVAAVALPGCIILSSKFMLKRSPRFHRWCGRIVGSLIMAVLVPTGIYLAWFARGGWWGTFGFWLSAAIVIAAAAGGFRAVRSKQYARHRKHAFQLLGQLSVAVTSRAMLYVLESRNMDADTAYIISLWVPVVGTFALIEYFVSPSRIQSYFRRFYESPFPQFRLARVRRANLP